MASEEEDDEILDTEWLSTFKEAESKYSIFYKKALTSIRLYVLYIKNKEIICRLKTRCRLDAEHCLKRERIISLIKHYQDHELTHYKLKSLLRYNIDLNPEEVGDFVNVDGISERFLTSEKYLDDIHFKDSIAMFRGLNGLYFIFFANEEEEAKGSAKAINHQTKRILLSKSKPHKTKRNNHKKNLKISKEIG